MLTFKRARDIDRLGDTLVRVLRELATRTGWSFSVVMGGMALDGSIKVNSIHHGETAAGNTFATSMTNYCDEVMKPFGEFLRRKHRESISSNVYYYLYLI